MFRCSAEPMEALSMDIDADEFSPDIETQQDTNTDKQNQDNDNSEDNKKTDSNQKDVRSDISALPNIIESRFEQLGQGAEVRPTIVKPGPIWTKKFQANLLSKPETSSLHEELQKKEKDGAYDLLDALTRSGAIPLQSAELHVFVAATHCFDKTLIETVIQNNQNPIEHVERSALVIASVLHTANPISLLTQNNVERMKQFAPTLFIE